MRKFVVYFQQVNQTAIEVSAHSEDEAVERAKKIWRRSYQHPVYRDIEEVEVKHGGKDGD